MNEIMSELVKEAKRIEEDAEFSSKGHYYASIPWRWGYRLMGTTSALLSSIVVAGILRQWPQMLLLVCATLAASLAAAIAFLKPGEEADRHQRSGDRYLTIRNDARYLHRVTATMDDATPVSLDSDLKNLHLRLNEVRYSAPKIPTSSYLKAKRDIEELQTAKHSVDKPCHPPS